MSLGGFFFYILSYFLKYISEEGLIRETDMKNFRIHLYIHTHTHVSVGIHITSQKEIIIKDTQLWRMSLSDAYVRATPSSLVHVTSYSLLID